MKTVDFTEAKERILGSFTAHWPNAKKDSDGYRLGDTAGSPGTSLHITADNGTYFDHATGEGGDVLELYRILHNLPSPTAAAQHALGITPAIAPARRSAPPAPSRLPWPHDLTEIEAGTIYGRRPPDLLTIYRDRDGLPMFAVSRWNDPTGKTILPSYYGRTAQGADWTKGLPEDVKKSRPLLDLPAVLTAEAVLVVEGEKCAAAANAAGLGILATTWHGGTANVKHADLEALAGKRVVIWPDHDEAGRKAADEIAHRLLGLASEVLRIVPPADMPSKWDCADCVAEPDGIARARRMIAEALPVSDRPIVRPLTDAGNAERLVDRYGNRIRWSVERKAWLTWDGKRWLIDHGGQIVRFTIASARRTATEAAGVEDDDERKTIRKWATRSEGRQHITAAADLARYIEGMSVLAEDLDADRDVLNTPSGIVDLRTGELTPNDPAALCTRMTAEPFEPTPEPLKSAPRFERFLAETFRYPELAEWIQVYLGYALTGRTDAHAFAVFHGIGANGKSCLLDIVARVGGDYVQAARAESIMQSDRRGETRNDLAALRGARLVVAQESAEGRALDEATIKALSSGDAITCRHLYAEDFSYKPTYKVCLVSNHKPRVKGTDEGIWRRLNLVPFANVVPIEKRDPLLADTIVAEEGPAILAWLVDGARKYYAAGHRLPRCPMIEDETREYRQEEDIVSQWLEDVVDVADGLKATADELYRHFSEYVAAKGTSRRWTAKDLGRALDEKQFYKDRPRQDGRRVVMYHGLRPIYRNPPSYTG